MSSFVRWAYAIDKHERASITRLWGSYGHGFDERVTDNFRSWTECETVHVDVKTRKKSHKRPFGACDMSLTPCEQNSLLQRLKSNVWSLVVPERAAEHLWDQFSTRVNKKCRKTRKNFKWLTFQVYCVQIPCQLLRWRADACQVPSTWKR